MDLKLIGIIVIIFGVVIIVAPLTPVIDKSDSQQLFWIKEVVGALFVIIGLTLIYVSYRNENSF